jgi:hypothetical protein
MPVYFRVGVAQAIALAPLCLSVAPLNGPLPSQSFHDFTT